MAYTKFEKNQLINLEYSLTRELLRTNRAGSYANLTIINCNTRKYHGLLVVPQPAIDNQNHVLLSSLDETVIQHDNEFNLAIHKFEGEIYNPRGHKYVSDFTTEPIPKLTYRVGGVVLTKEMLFTSNDDRLITKYTLEDAHSPTTLRFRPFLAYRNIHQLSKANVFVDTKYEPIRNGIRTRMYQGYSPINLQFSKEPEYVHVPDWYYNFEYMRENARGYDHLEDLYTPGFFEIPIKKGESIYFAAGLEEINPANISRAFNNEIKKRIPRDSFEHCLQNAAEQFVIKRGKRHEIIAGFPWFGRWGRDTFISLPGLTLLNGDHKTYKAVLDSMLDDMRGPLFPNMGMGDNAMYNTVDAPLWFFWTLQQHIIISNASREEIWKTYGKHMKAILEGYKNGAPFSIILQENGLISAGEPGKALTWMDAIVDGKPVTPRIGLAVEVNALWYNAVMFAIELARLSGETAFVEEWSSIAERIPKSFVETFWLDDKKYLADYVNGNFKDKSVRPNQVFATSLPYTPLNEEQRKGVLDRVNSELVTPRGLRSLAPKNIAYKGTYGGNQAERDLAYHQGSVYAWLLCHFAEGYLRIYEAEGLPYIEDLYGKFEEVMAEHGIGTISEVYDGDPPHKPGGAISQAWNVAELLRLHWLLKKYKKTNGKKKIITEKK
jgi:predicted glycogen debranching enzyme